MKRLFACFFVMAVLPLVSSPSRNSPTSVSLATVAYAGHSLIGGWCDRRELKPLRIVLRSYPLSSGRTDDWQQLYESLMDLEHLQASITADERDRLIAVRL